MSLIFAALLSPINDITTTLQASPLLKGQSYPEHFVERQKKLYPDLTPLRSTLQPEALMRLALEAAKEQDNWQVEYVEAQRLEAVETTPLMRFKDDIVIEVRVEEGNESSLHMRSRSRVGRSDLGANYKRILRYLKAVQDKISAKSGSL